MARAELRDVPAQKGPDPTRNRIFAALTRAAPDWNPASEVVRLSSGDTLSSVDGPPRQVYFPLTCVLSKLTVMSDGRAVEFATIGREGVSNASELLTGEGMPIRVTCQVPGAALSVDGEQLRSVVCENAAVSRLLQRYTHTLLVQIAQIAACNRLHPVEQRCARWLLMTDDRVAGGEFLLTQEFLAQMLGVRRARVNVAAGILQRAGLIRYTRGRIRIIDRVGLENAACECYGVIRAEYDRLAADVLAAG